MIYPQREEFMVNYIWKHILKVLSRTVEKQQKQQ